MDAADPMMAVLTAVQEPLTRRARHELLFCLIGVGIGQVVLAAFGTLVFPGTAASVFRAATVLVILVPIAVATGAARGLGAACRRLVVWLLGSTMAASPPVPVRRGRLGRVRSRLRDPGGWKALAYLMLKPPLGVLELYALLYWAGLANLSYPFWWRMFRNHSPGVHLHPVPFITPFGAFHVATFPGTLVVFGTGVAMLMLAPWVTRAVTSVDRWLARGLLGPGRLARVHDLERTRAQVLEDSAARLRRIERDLHDGAQAQLATLSMKLGQAKEKLEQGSGVPYDPAGARELIDAAHRHAKEVLVELRDLARGIHPPVLDVGLDAALATLVARSAVPTTLTIDLSRRPAQSIETIAYFSAAELLANVAKHSRAGHAAVEVTARNGILRLQVTDDGVGGAQPGAGSGLTGLANRARAVDGTLRLSSPAGGPTAVTVELPLN
jgi:signal transduction histidine kinase